MTTQAGGTTRIDQASRLSRLLGVDLRIKRDDLYPCSGGGNKGRKIRPFLKDIAATGCDAVVTNGGVQSNHARVAALAAAEQGWPCRLVLHGEPEALDDPKGNLLLMKLAGADIDIVPPERFAGQLEFAMQMFRDSGRIPYLIPGGGHSVLGSATYADAVDEVATQSEEWIPEVIVLASGTGTTQAGILAGVERRNWNVRLIGVSVARRNPRGTAVTQSAYDELRSHLKLSGSELTVEFRDEWIDGGYEVAGSRVLETIRETARNGGLILDPTYTGKAFMALTDLVKNGEIASGAKVLFWHTGGLLNLMASPCWSTTTS